MATQSAMRMVESDRTQKWPSSKGTAIFGSPLNDIAVDELGFLLKRHGLHGDRQTAKIPNRSGSAPPSMEGSFAAIRNLLAQHETNSEVLGQAIEKFESEEEIRSDPAYLSYYFSNINLNPRLPPPLISQENSHLAHCFDGFGDNLRSTSLDNLGNQSLNPSRSALSTHKEEPEDEASGELSMDCWAEKVAVSSMGRHKSLVDLIQEDFPRTPSPVYNQSRTSSSHATTEEPIDHDVIPSELPGSDLNSIDNISGDTHNISPVSDEDPFAAAMPSTHSIDGTRSSDNRSTKVANQEDYQMRKNQEVQQSYGRKVGSQYMSSPNPVQIGQVQTPMHGYPKLSSPEVQSPFQSPGLAPPPLYTTTAAYMTSASPYYHNYQPSGLYSPHYNFCGYPQGSSPLVPPYMTGYLPQGTAVPLPFDASSGSSYNARVPGVSTGQNVPPFMDPFQMQYFQQHLGEAYGTPFHYGPAAAGSNGDFFAQKDPIVGNQKLQIPTNENLGLQNSRHVGVYGSNYYGVIPQYPPSPLASPVLPSSPVSGMSHFGRRNEMRHPQGMNRNTGIYGGWQGQRGGNCVDDLKRHSFLEELKSTNARKLELTDIAGRIVEFSVDQHGSRFIQQKLEHCSDEEKASVFNEVVPHASRLMTDVFGNYVIQKFLEHGSPEQRKELADQLVGQMVPLSLQMYGCRVIQKALEVIEVDQKTKLVHELDGHVMRCVRDQNGNHVIQKCIECVPPNRIGFIILAFRSHVATLSTHPYGCRVIQRILEHCSDDEQTRCIVDEIMESAFTLAHDQYGNYVTQHVLERGKPHERREIINKLTGHIVQMSQHKYASNVVEKCLEHADGAERELLIGEIIGKSEEDNRLLAMMKDQFANYVVQKVLEISRDKQREVLLERIQAHLQALRKYTYGKHIATRFEQLFGEEIQASEEST